MNRRFTRAFSRSLCRRVALGLLAPICVGLTPGVAWASAGSVTKIKLGHVSAALEAVRQPGAYVAVDPASDIVAVTGSVGANNASAVAGGRVWLVNGQKHKLSRVLDLPGASVSSIADDSSTRTFYVADPDLTVAPDTSAGGVAVISARTGKLTDEIPAAGISGGVGVDSKTNSVDLTGAGYAITPVNARTRAVASPLGSGYVLYPTSISIDPKTDVAYVVSDQVTGVWFVKLSTGYLYGVSSTVRSNISTTGESIGVATDPGTGHTYVALDGSDGSEVGTIDGTRGRFAATKQLKNGSETLGIAVDPATHDVYVANANETSGCPGLVDDISEHTGKVIATVYNVTDPEAVAVDSSSDTVYVDNEGVLDAFRGGISIRQEKCGTTGVVVGIRPSELGIPGV